MPLPSSRDAAAWKRDALLINKAVSTFISDKVAKNRAAATNAANIGTINHHIMLDTQWEALIGRIKDTFPVEDEVREELAGGPGQRHAVAFQGPEGNMLVERIVRPLVLGTHALSANRIGASSTVVHEYSETETTSTVRLFRWQDEEWQEVDMRGLGAQGGADR